MVEHIVIDRRTLVEMGPEVFRKLHEGAIFHVRAIDEIFILRDHIDAQLRLRGDSYAEGFKQFVERHIPLSEEVGAAVVLILREIRDSRFLSCLFSDLVAGFGLPSNRLIDAGYFRCIFQGIVPALQSRMERKELPRDLFQTENVAEPEPFMMGTNAGGNPHRDIDPPHYTFQINFWFPLHDIPAGNSVLMFPKVYTEAVQYQNSPDVSANPDGWGFGPALRHAMSLGDTLIFHSQHYHASPSETPHLDRLSAELRIASGCHDDNANAYRRQFWNLTNFAQIGSGSLRERASALHPHIRRPAAQALTAHQIFASLFDNAQAARLAANLWTPDTVFEGTQSLPGADLLDISDRLRRAPFAEDRQLAFARYLKFHGKTQLVRMVLQNVLERTESYFFALEAARLAGEATLYELAAASLMKAATLANQSDIRIGRYRGDVPDRGWPYIQLLPNDAHNAATRLMTILRDFLAAPADKPEPLLDHRLFFPNYYSAHYFCGHAVVFIWSLYIFIPAERLNDVRLSLTENKVEGVLDRDAMARDPRGIFVTYSNHELYREILRRGIIKAEGEQPNIQHTHA